MYPYIWGKYLWASIHFISLGYPIDPSSDDKAHYKSYYEGLQNIIPCSSCSNSYKNHLNELPLTDEVLKDTKSLFKWTVDMHNLVNVTINKATMSHNEAYQLYTINHEKHNNTMNSCFSSLSSKKIEDSKFGVIIFMFILIILILIFTFKRKFLKKLFGI